jgi:hypothetical protein
MGVAGVAHAAADPLQQIQVTPLGTIVTPGASLELPEARGRAAHANIHILHPAEPRTTAGPYGVWETPASLACLYGLTKQVAGCNPRTLKTVATGGSRVIAIVDAFDDPNAMADLVTFSTQFGLPAVTAANFSVVYASGQHWRLGVRNRAGRGNGPRAGAECQDRTRGGGLQQLF